MSKEPDPRLDDMTLDEWWDVCRAVAPDVTRDEFEREWAEFQRAKKFRH